MNAQFNYRAASRAGAMFAGTTIVLGDDSYGCSNVTRNHVGGVQITRFPGRFKGGTGSPESWFIPYESLKRVKMEFRGAEKI